MRRLLPAYVSILISLLLSKANSQSPCESSQLNSLRLNNNGVFSSITSAGRVEICVCIDISNTICRWQTVSTGSTTEPISWKNSIVVCRDLGYQDVQSPILQSTVESDNHASSLVSIYPTTFNCDGSESSLIDCSTGVSTVALTHEADAYVQCDNTVVPTQKVRLTGTTLEDEGVVEFYVSNDWRTICPDFFDDTEANLVCVSLGYSSGTATTYSRTSFAGNSINSVPSIDTLSCDNSPYYFSSCTYTIGSTCSSLTTLAGARCTIDDSTEEGSVRLFGTANFNYERVEVFYNGRWGTVCDSAWDFDDGQVTCRELGDDPDQTAIPTTSQTFNSLSSRPIWILSYNCLGTESSLSDCPRPQFPVGFVSSTCSHSTDAGVDCVPHSEEGGGLSGGAIAGIVIGVILFLGGVGWFLGFQDKMKRRRIANARQRHVNRATAAAVVTTATTTPTVTTSGSTSIELTATSGTSNQGNGGAQPPTPADPSLSQAPPPSYNEALTHLDVKEPPKYSDEEKKLPYPVSSDMNPAYPSAPPSNPAYPSAPPPAPTDYQGYPPPTQPAFTLPGSLPYPPDPATSYPYPPTAPPTGSDLPYPT